LARFSEIPLNTPSVLLDLAAADIHDKLLRIAGIGA